MDITVGILMLLSILNDETLFMPEPTPEIKALIVKLGDDEFKVREAASLKLEKMGWPALKGLAQAARSSPDLEVRTRAQRSYERYFAIVSDDKDNLWPGIWYMNEKKRFPDGFKLEAATQDHMGSTCKALECQDVARVYFERAMHKLKLFDERGVGAVGYTNQDVMRQATSLYIRDMLKTGMKREDVKKVLNEMAKNAKEYTHYYQTENLDTPTYDWGQRPPGPMIKKEDFKEPSWGP